MTVTGDAPAGRRARAARLDPDTLAALEEERDFLLRSLDDLEREHEAGDVDDHDYEVLKDDYTARAARVIRAIETHQARLAAARRPRSRRRVALTTLGVVAFAVLAGVLVADAAGRRGSGDTLTGDIRTSTRDRLGEALELAAEQRYDEAVEVYDEILAEQPDHAEALTYKGWAQYLSGDPEGIGTLTAAVEADPEFPDAHAFLALILARAGRTDAALMELDRLEALDPPPDVAALVSGLRAELEAQQAGTGAGGDAGGAP
ncbi:MAG: tetratricopeptide repeat protein [Thermoanaerobacterales bacterium]|nr:tetratricopeptide repeat protein [Thermoanaerobacterales bacterium]